MIKGEDKQYNFEKERADIFEYLVILEDFHTALQMLNVLRNKISNYGQFKNFEMWYVLYNSGYCLRELKMYSNSIELLEKSFEYTKKIGEDSNYLKSLWMLAEVYKKAEEYKIAKHLYNDLMTFYKKNNNNIDRILMMLSVSELDCNMRRVYCLTNCLFDEIKEQGLANSNVYKKKMIKQIREIVTKIESKQINDEYKFYSNKINSKLDDYEKQQFEKNLLNSLSQ